MGSPSAMGQLLPFEGQAAAVASVSQRRGRNNAQARGTVRLKLGMVLPNFCNLRRGLAYLSCLSAR